MTLPALVLVHGGGLAADFWELTVGEILEAAATMARQHSPLLAMMKGDQLYRVITATQLLATALTR